MSWNFQMVMDCINSAVVCVLDGKKTEYATGAEAVKAITGKYSVENISADGNKVVVNLKLDTTVPNDMNADWVKEHIKMYGKEPEVF